MEEKINEILRKEYDKALKKNEVPVSCIITKDSKIVSYAHNNKVTKNNPIAHAEIEAIRKAGKKLKTSNLTGCTLYVSLYPCKMCLEAIKEARIKKICYILDKEKEVNLKVVDEKFSSPNGIYFKENLKRFFKEKR